MQNILSTVGLDGGCVGGGVGWMWKVQTDWGGHTSSFSFLFFSFLFYLPLQVCTETENVLSVNDGRWATRRPHSVRICPYCMQLSLSTMAVQTQLTGTKCASWLTGTHTQCLSFANLCCFLSNVPRYLQDIALFERPQTWPACPSELSIINMRMNTEHERNDTDGEKSKNPEKSLSMCYSVHHKSHVDNWDRTWSSMVACLNNRIYIYINSILLSSQITII